jgi:hypothetical protein
MPVLHVRRILVGMTERPPVQTAQRVEVSSVGAAPVWQLRRAAGVSDVEIDGLTLRCVVFGSFQPYLEALHGYEAITLTSTPAPSSSKESP